ncbi:MAG TPA: hypothetical protein VGE21_13050 [Flavobacteriales bacterium]
MARIHLFEFEDLAWFPKAWRDHGTDFLQFLANRTNMYAPVVPLLADALVRSGDHTIVDLASGGGGGLLRLNKELLQHDPRLRIILTDRFPNTDAFAYTEAQAPNISSVSTPVDARNVPAELKGLRTQFLSLHHFRPADAARILQNAVDASSAIAVVEAQERSVPSLIGAFFSPLTVLFTTPFIRPFKWGRLFWTYVIPVVPLFIWWDGIVSSFRTYSVAEMEGLVAGLQHQDRFDWRIGRVRSGPSAILYLIGVPKA